MPEGLEWQCPAHLRRGVVRPWGLAGSKAAPHLEHQGDVGMDVLRSVICKHGPPPPSGDDADGDGGGDDDGDDDDDDDDDGGDDDDAFVEPHDRCIATCSPLKFGCRRLSLMLMLA